MPNDRTVDHEVFEDDHGEGEDNDLSSIGQDEVFNTSEKCSLGAPPFLPPQSTSASSRLLPTEVLEQIPKSVSYRPLPEIPDMEPPWQRSFETWTPSIAASPSPYLEDNLVEAEIGMATQMPIRSDSLPTLAEHRVLPSPPELRLSTDYASSPPCSVRSRLLEDADADAAASQQSTRHSPSNQLTSQGINMGRYDSDMPLVSNQEIQFEAGSTSNDGAQMLAEGELVLVKRRP